MAINFTDFSKAPLLDSPAASIFENVLKGYKMEQEPAKMQEEQSARQLANQLRKLEVDHKPKEFELSDQQKSLANALQSKALEHYEEKFGMARDLNKARINKLNNKSTTNVVKPNGKVANIAWVKNELKDPNIDPEYANQLKTALKDESEHIEAVTNRSKDMTSGAGFDKLPANEKKRAVALTTSMGIDPIEGAQMLRSGKNLQDIAKEKGVKLEDVTPVYPLGEENIKQLQRRAGYVNEIKKLETKLGSAMGEYQNKILGYSLNQVADALTGENPDKQGRVLAARALQPELVALRLKAAGANIGIEAINELKSKSLGDMKILEGLVDTPTFLAMQKYMTEWIEEASNEFQRTQEDYGRLKTRQQKSAEAESGVKVYNPATGRLE